MLTNSSVVQYSPAFEMSNGIRLSLTEISAEFWQKIGRSIFRSEFEVNDQKCAKNYQNLKKFKN